MRLKVGSVRFRPSLSPTPHLVRQSSKKCTFLEPASPLSTIRFANTDSSRFVEVTSGQQIFEPHVDPSQFVSVAILCFFFIIQMRIRKANSIADMVVKNESALKKLKAKQLSSGDINVMDEINSLEETTSRLRDEENSLKTFLVLNNVALRFRTPSTTSSTDSDVEADTVKEKTNSNTNEKDDSLVNEGHNGKDGDEGELSLVYVSIGVAVVLSLSYVLSLLSIDPMNSLQ